MNKTLSLAIVSVMAIGGAFAQAPAKMKKAAAPTTIACAVMPNNKVNIADATKKKMYADYKGHRYFFCCGGCPDAFKASPAKYAKAASIVTPAAPKAKATKKA